MDLNYKAVVFDLYGTLLDIRTDEDAKSLWQRLAYYYSAQGAVYAPETLQASYLQYVEEALEKVRQKGIDSPECNLLKVFKRLFKAKGIKPSKRILDEAALLFRFMSLEYVLPYPGAFELLEMIKSQHVKLILLSNAQAAFTMTELKATGIKPYFDSIYLSSDYKMSKPFPGFYTMMLEKEGLEAKDCLFIGNDHRTDIAGANSVGMDSLYLHTNCSPNEVPNELASIWRVDSGDLFEVIQLIQ